RNNCEVPIAAGARLRFVRCTLNDVALSFNDVNGAGGPAAPSAPVAFVEFVDCDQMVTGLPGNVDYDKLTTNGVGGLYDRFNQHLPQRVLTSSQSFSPNSSVVKFTRNVLTGPHADCMPGVWGI